MLPPRTTGPLVGAPLDRRPDRWLQGIEAATSWTRPARPAQTGEALVRLMRLRTSRAATSSEVTSVVVGRMATIIRR